MQEFVILLSSVAGACTAAAVRKFPKSKRDIISFGANPHFKSQINSLKIEKDILTKTISRLYQQNPELAEIQRDRLLQRYQHQLGIVLSKIEKLEATSKHPDLGPVGEGLITLIDKKLSDLDDRLSQISSKISISNTRVPEIKEPIKSAEKEEQLNKTKIKLPTVENTAQKIIVPPIKSSQAKPSNPVELTTLTELPKRQLEFPFFNQKQEVKTEIISEMVKTPPKSIQEEKIKILQSSMGSIELDNDAHQTELIPKVLQQPQEGEKEKSPTQYKPKKEALAPAVIAKKSQPSINLPEDDKLEEDEDDLTKIKGEIMKTLSKLEQAEVE